MKSNKFAKLLTRTLSDILNDLQKIPGNKSSAIVEAKTYINDHSPMQVLQLYQTQPFAVNTFLNCNFENVLNSKVGPAYLKILNLANESQDDGVVVPRKGSNLATIIDDIQEKMKDQNINEDDKSQMVAITMQELTKKMSENVDLDGLRNETLDFLNKNGYNIDIEKIKTDPMSILLDNNVNLTDFLK